MIKFPDLMFHIFRKFWIVFTVEFLILIKNLIIQSIVNFRFICYVIWDDI